MIKHPLKFETPLHKHGEIRNREKDQEQIKKEKNTCSTSVNHVEEMEDTCIMSAERLVSSFGANDINMEKKLKANIQY